MKQFLFLAAVFLLIAGCTQQDECSGFEGAARDNCYNSLAFDSQDYTVCNKIAQDAFKNACIAEVVILKGGRELCSEAGGISESYCLSSIASSELDLELCRSIEDKGWRDSCRNGIAFATDDAVLCREIERRELRDTCLSGISIKLNQSSSCSFIFDEFERDRCFVKVAIALKEPELCAMTKDTLAADACYKSIARVANDSSICGFISFKEIRSDCKELFG